MNFVKPGAAQAAFTLIHISDFHLCCPTGVEFSRFLNKRAFSYSSWKIRRQHEHRIEILRALTRAVHAEAFDHLAVTGDLTQLGLPAEFEQARLQLHALGPPDKVFVVPGNHDALVPAAWNVSFAHWSDFMASDSAESGAFFPTLRIRGPVALIGLSTAHPTPLFSAAGSIGAAQLARCAQLLSETAQRNLYRVLLIHHPPLPNAVSAHKRLKDAESLLPLIRQHGAELILHGHSHRRSRGELPGPSTPVPVLGISSASASVRNSSQRATFRVFRMRRVTAGWATACQDHVFDPERGQFTPEPEIIL
jgi:3',5'-cyclic AMP phosphodiesterase CpdA